MNSDLAAPLKTLRERVTCGSLTHAVKQADPLTRAMAGMKAGDTTPEEFFWTNVAPFGVPVLMLARHFRRRGGTDIHACALNALGDIHDRNKLRSGFAELSAVVEMAKQPDLRLTMLSLLATSGLAFNHHQAMERAVAEGLPLARRRGAQATRLVIVQAAIFGRRGDYERAERVVSEELESLRTHDLLARSLAEGAVGHLKLCRFTRERNAAGRGALLDAAFRHLDCASRLHLAACVPSWADITCRRIDVELAYVSWKRSGNIEALARLGPCMEPWTLIAADALLLELLLRLKTKQDTPGACRRRCYRGLSSLDENHGDALWRKVASPLRAGLTTLNGLASLRSGKAMEAITLFKEADDLACATPAEWRAHQFHLCAISGGPLFKGAVDRLVTTGDFCYREPRMHVPSDWSAIEDDELWNI